MSFFLQSSRFRIPSTLFTFNLFFLSFSYLVLSFLPFSSTSFGHPFLSFPFLPSPIILIIPYRIFSCNFPSFLLHPILSFPSFSYLSAYVHFRIYLFLSYIIKQSFLSDVHLCSLFLPFFNSSFLLILFYLSLLFTFHIVHSYHLFTPAYTFQTIINVYLTFTSASSF